MVPTNSARHRRRPQGNEDRTSRTRDDLAQGSVRRCREAPQVRRRHSRGMCLHQGQQARPNGNRFLYRGCFGRSVLANSSSMEGRRQMPTPFVCRDPGHDVSDASTMTRTATAAFTTATAMESSMPTRRLSALWPTRSTPPSTHRGASEPRQDASSSVQQTCPARDFHSPLTADR